MLRTAYFGLIHVRLEGDRFTRCNSCRQRNKNVAIPCHDYAKAAGRQNVSETLRHVQCHVFFCNPLSRNTTAIMTAVSRVNNYREIVGGGTAFLFCRRISVYQDRDQCACDKETGSI